MHFYLIISYIKWVYRPQHKRVNKHFVYYLLFANFVDELLGIFVASWLGTVLKCSISEYSIGLKQTVKPPLLTTVLSIINNIIVYPNTVFSKCKCINNWYSAQPTLWRLIFMKPIAVVQIQYLKHFVAPTNLLYFSMFQQRTAPAGGTIISEYFQLWYLC